MIFGKGGGDLGHHIKGAGPERGGGSFGPNVKKAYIMGQKGEVSRPKDSSPPPPPPDPQPSIQRRWQGGVGGWIKPPKSLGKTDKGRKKHPTNKKGYPSQTHTYSTWGQYSTTRARTTGTGVLIIIGLLQD